MLLSEICGLVSGGRPLWRENGSAICSVITHWSESLRTRYHIFCLIWDYPNLEGQVPVFIFSFLFLHSFIKLRVSEGCYLMASEVMWYASLLSALCSNAMLYIRGRRINRRKETALSSDKIIFFFGVSMKPSNSKCEKINKSLEPYCILASCYIRFTLNICSFVHQCNIHFLSFIIRRHVSASHGHLQVL
jgi:hypothetical protein